MADDAAVFLITARQEPGNVYQIQQRDIEGIAETDKPGCFIRGIDIKAACHDLRLVGNDADSLSIHAGKTGNNICSPILLGFVKFAVVDNCCDNGFHIVSLIGIIRQQSIQAGVDSLWVVACIYNGRRFQIIGRQEAQQITDLC